MSEAAIQQDIRLALGSHPGIRTFRNNVGAIKDRNNRCYLCGIGKRQSPIAIQSDATLQGPAEALQFHYAPSNGTVVNTTLAGGSSSLAPSSHRSRMNASMVASRSSGGPRTTPC